MLEFHGTAEPYKNRYAFKKLLDTCYAKEWVPYCKKPFCGAESIIKYLGKYTHRIAISNYRIKGMSETHVTYAVKDYKNQGQWKKLTISGEEFIRRFLMHVPPKRFVRMQKITVTAIHNLFMTGSLNIRAVWERMYFLNVLEKMIRLYRRLIVLPPQAESAW